MRRHITKQSKLPKIIALSVVAFAVVYSVAWYMVSTHVKNLALVHIENLSKEQSLVFNYSSLKVRGYPFYIELQFSQPKLRKELASIIETPTTPDPTSESSETNELATPALTIDIPNSASAVVEPVADAQSALNAGYEISVDDKVGIRMNVFAHAFSLNIYGDTHYSATKDGQKWHVVVSSPFLVTAQVKFLDNSLLKNILFPTKYPMTLQSLAANPFVITLDGKELSSVNGETKDPLTTIESLYTSFEQRFDTNNPSILPVHAKFHAKNYASTKAADMFWESVKDSFFKSRQLDYISLVSKSAHGKSNLDVDVEAIIPLLSPSSTVAQYFSLNNPFAITVNQADFSSDLIQGTTNGMISVKKEGESDQAPALHVVYHASSQITEGGHELYLNNLKASFERTLAIFSNSTPSMANDSTTFLKYLVANPDEIKAITPKLYELGKLQTDIDVELKGSNITIRQADIITKDYSAKLQGYYQDDSKTPAAAVTGKGKITLQLANYKKLTDDSIGYLNRLFTAYNKAYNIEQAPIIFSDSLKTDVNKLLEQWSDTPATPSDNITITVQNEGNQLLPTIGTLPLFQAAAKAQELIEPHFTKASAVTPAPSLDNSTNQGAATPAPTTTLPAQSLPDPSVIIPTPEATPTETN